MGSLAVIGLAGGIGAGKSAVAQELEKLGCVVSDSDTVAKQALNRPAVLATLRRWWGDGVIASDGAADRAAIAKLVFADPAQRERLESLTHPLVHKERRSAVERAATDGARAFVIDAPLLFEAGVDEECDAVIFVDAPREIRLERVRARGWDEEELNRREAAQRPIEQKRAASDVIIENGGDRRGLGERVGRALEEALRIAGQSG